MKTNIFVKVEGEKQTSFSYILNWSVEIKNTLTCCIEPSARRFSGMSVYVWHPRTAPQYSLWA